MENDCRGIWNRTVCPAGECNHAGTGCDILPEARFEEDLEADSFDMAAVLMETDDAFDTNIPSETTEYIRTVEDLMELIPQYPASASEEKPVRWRSGF